MMTKDRGTDASKMSVRLPTRLQMDRWLVQYRDTLDESALTDNSVTDYYYFASCFVRWLYGEFEPGENVR